MQHHEHRNGSRKVRALPAARGHQPRREQTQAGHPQEHFLDSQDLRTDGRPSRGEAVSRSRQEQCERGGRDEREPAAGRGGEGHEQSDRVSGEDRPCEGGAERGPIVPVDPDSSPDIEDRGHYA